MRKERTLGGLWTERTKDLIATLEMAIIRKGQLRDQPSASALIHCQEPGRAVQVWQLHSPRAWTTNASKLLIYFTEGTSEPSLMLNKSAANVM